MPVAVSEPALALTVALAWTAHIDRLNDFFNSIAEDEGSSMEKTVWAEELSIGLRVIRNHALRKLTDVDDNEDNADGSASANRVASLLSGQKIRPTLGESSKLDVILKKLDEFNGPVTASAQEPVVYERLYAILKQAVFRRLPGLELDESKLTSILSRLFAEFLASQSHKFTSINAFEGLASHTIAYLEQGDSFDCKWEDVHNEFESLVSFHIQLLAAHAPAEATTQLAVSRLREKGNNLMINTCYPQAIQVYTDAIHACDHLTRTHVPQLYTNRAIAYIGLNCFPEAVSDLQKALVHDRACVPAWTQLGYCQLYMGHTILALKCYLAAIRSVAGEIYPYRFPSNESLRQQYTEAKARSAMPQFVQKLVSSVVLAVKRAEQQQEPLDETQEVGTRVRAILARLRKFAAAEDFHYFEYATEPDLVTLRNSAVRADTVRPSILTPDVAQDIMASANVEASAVTLNGPPQARTDVPISIIPANVRVSEPRPAGEAGSETDTGAQEPNGSEEQSPNEGGIPQNFRGFLNTLGDVVGNVISEATGSMDEASRVLGETAPQDSLSGTPQNQNRPELVHLPSVSNANNNGPGNGQPVHGAPPNSHISRALSSVRRALSGNNTANSGLMDAALRQHQAAIERMLSGQGAPPPGNVQSGANGAIRASGRAQPFSGPGPGRVRIVRPRGPTETSRSGPVAANSGPVPRLEIDSETHTSQEDTDMPDALDLD